LLGFSGYTQRDIHGALRVVGNYQAVIGVHFAAGAAFNSFTDFIPFSDSIFLVADDPNLFTEQISQFLVDCFLLTALQYTNPINPADPTDVVVKEIDYDPQSRKAITNNVNQKWFPAIFKGGITAGEVIRFRQGGLTGGNRSQIDNLAGKAVTRAALLEKSGRGPRLFTDEDFMSQLSQNTKDRYLFADKGVFEILWPASIYNPQNDPELELINGFRKLFDPAVNLWKAVCHLNIGPIYYNLLKIIVHATLRHFKLVNHEARSIQFIEQAIDTHGLANQKTNLLFEKSFI
jgi:hypothetical protein